MNAGSLVVSLTLLTACGSNDSTPSTSTGGVPSTGSGGTPSTSAGGTFSGNGGIGVAGTSAGGVPPSGGGGLSATGGTTQTTGGSSNTGDAAAPTKPGMIAGADVHAYPKPTAWGFTAADGKDRMGDALLALGSPVVRGPTIGDTAFLARLASFGVKEVVLGLSASLEGKPFDPAAVGPLLKMSVDAAKQVGLTVQVEGLNEWDLFNTRSYNAGVLPSGMSASEFVLHTQQALYEAAHALGIVVLGPSVGHPGDAPNLAFFPDVSAYVDIVNMHLYFTSNPEALPIPTRVADHERFQGSGKPVWVTETGISSYGGVTADGQADVISRGLGVFDASKLIARAYIYDLLEDQKPGVSGTTVVPDSAEYHFGLFTFEGTAKPSAKSFQDFMGVP